MRLSVGLITLALVYSTNASPIGRREAIQDVGNGAKVVSDNIGLTEGHNAADAYFGGSIKQFENQSGLTEASHGVGIQPFGTVPITKREAIQEIGNGAKAFSDLTGITEAHNAADVYSQGSLKSFENDSGLTEAAQNVGIVGYGVPVTKRDTIVGQGQLVGSALNELGQSVDVLNVKGTAPAAYKRLSIPILSNINGDGVTGSDGVDSFEGEVSGAASALNGVGQSVKVFNVDGTSPLPRDTFEGQGQLTGSILNQVGQAVDVLNVDGTAPAKRDESFNGQAYGEVLDDLLQNVGVFNVDGSKRDTVTGQFAGAASALNEVLKDVDVLNVKGTAPAPSNGFPFKRDDVLGQFSAAGSALNQVGQAVDVLNVDGSAPAAANGFPFKRDDVTGQFAGAASALNQVLEGVNVFNVDGTAPAAAKRDDITGQFSAAGSALNQVLEGVDVFNVDGTAPSTANGFPFKRDDVTGQFAGAASALNQVLEGVDVLNVKGTAPAPANGFPFKRDDVTGQFAAAASGLNGVLQKVDVFNVDGTAPVKRLGPILSNINGDGVADATSGDDQFVGQLSGAASGLNQVAQDVNVFNVDGTAPVKRLGPILSNINGDGVSDAASSTDFVGQASGAASALNQVGQAVNVLNVDGSAPAKRFIPILSNINGDGVTDASSSTDFVGQASGAASALNQVGQAVNVLNVDGTAPAKRFIPILSNINGDGAVGTSSFLGDFQGAAAASGLNQVAQDVNVFNVDGTAPVKRLGPILSNINEDDVTDAIPTDDSFVGQISGAASGLNQVAQDVNAFNVDGTAPSKRLYAPILSNINGAGVAGGDSSFTGEVQGALSGLNQVGQSVNAANVQGSAPVKRDESFAGELNGSALNQLLQTVGVLNVNGDAVPASKRDEYSAQIQGAITALEGVLQKVNVFNVDG